MPIPSQTLSVLLTYQRSILLEEGGGFEPPELLNPLIFKISAIDRSAILPFLLVGKERLELSRLSARASKTLMSAIPSYSHSSTGTSGET